MKEISREEYISEIKYCYDNSRWEFSFYAVLYLYFCQFRIDNKIKLVHCADWKSRRNNTSEAMKKNLNFCSTKFKDKNDEEKIGGIPDFQFVPWEYSYGKPCKVKVFIEFKAPTFSPDGKYVPLNKKSSELKKDLKFNMNLKVVIKLYLPTVYLGIF